MGRTSTGIHQYQKLRKEAIKHAVRRGHQLRGFHRLPCSSGPRGRAECKLCEREIDVIVFPLPNETRISGSVCGEHCPGPKVTGAADSPETDSRIRTQLAEILGIRPDVLNPLKDRPRCWYWEDGTLTDLVAPKVFALGCLMVYAYDDATCPGDQHPALAFQF